MGRFGVRCLLNRGSRGGSGIVGDLWKVAPLYDEGAFFIWPSALICVGGNLPRLCGSPSPAAPELPGMILPLSSFSTCTIVQPPSRLWRQPPELRGACEGSFPRERLCQLSRTVRDWLFSHFRLGPIDQPTRLRCAQAPSQNLGGLERFDLWRLFSKVQLTFPGGPDRGRFSLFPTCTESKPPSPGSRELPPMGGFSKVPGEFTVKSAVPLHRGSMFLLSHFLLVPIDQPTRRLPPPSQNLGGLERFDL